MALTLEELTDWANAWTYTKDSNLVLLINGEETPLKFRYATMSSIALEIDKIIPQTSDYERIIRILNRQLKRGGPSNFEEVCGHWMDEEQKKLYLSIVTSEKQ